MKAMAIKLVFLALAGALASACSFGTGTPIVLKADLEADIAEIVKEAGVQPESVTCRGDLVGEVGQTTQCEIEASPVDALLAPIVTVTGVDSTVNWELKPALTQQQLERTVAAGANEAMGKAPDSVSCESGLEGEKGNVAYCNVTADGATVRRTIEVTNVDGLAMDHRVLPMLTKAMVEEALQNELTAQFGLRPDAVTCSGDLEGRIGKTVECIVVTGPESQTLVLTVESLHGDQILWRYEPAS
jgi:hypothetical protein